MMKKNLIKIVTLGTILSASLAFAQPMILAQAASTTTPAQTKAQKKAAAKAAKASAATTTTATTKATPPVKTSAVAPATTTVAPKPAPAPLAVSAKPAAATPPPAAAKTTAPKAAPTPVNSGDIASAKSKGMVWVNLNTKVYHGSGDKEYGTTKNGKFMTEADAKAAGAREAKK